LKIAAEPLQMKTWLLSTAYRKSLAPYPMVPMRTSYDLPFTTIHPWRQTNGRTDGNRANSL